MRHFCFGSFLKVLSLCSPRSTTNKFLCGNLFLAVNPSYDILNEDATVSRLISCTDNVSTSITNLIADADPTRIQDCFERMIIPMLFPEKRRQMVLALTDLLIKDEDIPDTVKVGTISGYTKWQYKNEVNYNLADFLTDFFLFAIRACDNKSGKAYIKEVTSDYIRSLDEKKENIH